MSIAFAALTIAATTALLVAEWRGSARWRRIAKCVASASFVAVGLTGAAGGLEPRVAWVLVGLALGAAGDVALLGDSKRALAAGIGLFLAGHLAYVAAFAPAVTPTAPLALAFAGFLAVGIAAAAYVWPRAGSLRPAVLAYVGVIVAMATAAVGAGDWRVSVGGVLFFASDLAVARHRFRVRSQWNKLVGLPLYYAAQLLIALSVAGA